jgi:hypothetical protein
VLCCRSGIFIGIPAHSVDRVIHLHNVCQQTFYECSVSPPSPSERHNILSSQSGCEREKKIGASSGSSFILWPSEVHQFIRYGIRCFFFVRAHILRSSDNNFPSEKHDIFLITSAL